MTLHDRPDLDAVFTCLVPVDVGSLLRADGRYYRVKECSKCPEGGYYVGAVSEDRYIDLCAEPADA